MFCGQTIPWPSSQLDRPLGRLPTLPTLQRLSPISQSRSVTFATRRSGASLLPVHDKQRLARCPDDLEDLPRRLQPVGVDTSSLGVPSAPRPFLCERHLHPREQCACRRIINHRDQRDLRDNTMKRLLLIGVAACTFALAPILAASAMPSANLNALIGADTSIIQVHGWGHHGGRGHHYGWGRGHHYGWRHHHRW